MLFGAPKVIGLDIGNASIKLAELDVSKKSAKLISFGVVPTPSGVVNARGELSDPLLVSQTIQQALSQIQTKRKSAVASVWGSTAMIKKISIPQSMEEEKLLAGQVRWEAEQYIPYDISEINIDYHVLQNQGKNQDVTDVLLVAGQKSHIFSFAEAIESSGLGCCALDVGGLAIANCFEFNYGFAPGEAIAVLDVGASITNLVIVDNAEVVFCRDIPVGGGSFTNEIHQQMGLTLEEAEALKLTIGSGSVPPDVNNIVQSTCEYVCEEIHRSIDFYNTSMTDNRSIQKVYMTGGGSLTPGLRESLGKTFNLTVQAFNPFQSIGFDSKKLSTDYVQQIAPFVSLAMGLGLRKMGDA